MKQLSQKHLLLYSFVGSLLLVVLPFWRIFEDDRHDGIKVDVLLDISLLAVTVFCAFYASLRANLLWQNRSFKQRILWNISLFIGISLVTSLLHIPLWLHHPIYMERGTLSFFVREEFLRNATVFPISFLMAQWQKEQQESTRIQGLLNLTEQQNLENQVEMLRQQLNPHFFFNSLNSLRSLIETDVEKSGLFIEKLSQVFRYSLELQEKKLVSLQEELAFAKAFIYLLEIRFENKISVDFEGELTKNAQIVPLASQLLIENAIKHNKINKQNPLKIVIEIVDNYLMISNSVNLQPNSDGTKIGLKNLDARCQFLVGKGIEIIENDLAFTVKVPLKNQ